MIAQLDYGVLTSMPGATIDDPRPNIPPGIDRRDALVRRNKAQAQLARHHKELAKNRAEKRKALAELDKKYDPLINAVLEKIENGNAELAQAQTDILMSRPPRLIEHAQKLIGDHHKKYQNSNDWDGFERDKAIMESKLAKIQDKLLNDPCDGITDFIESLRHVIVAPVKKDAAAPRDRVI